MEMKEATREEVIQWARSVGAEFNVRLHPLPTGWMWKEDYDHDTNDECLVLTCTGENIDQPDIKRSDVGELFMQQDTVDRHIQDMIDDLSALVSTLNARGRHHMAQSAQDSIIAVSKFRDELSNASTPHPVCLLWIPYIRNKP